MSSELRSEGWSVGLDSAVLGFAGEVAEALEGFEFDFSGGVLVNLAPACLCFFLGVSSTAMDLFTGAILLTRWKFNCDSGLACGSQHKKKSKNIFK